MHCSVIAFGQCDCRNNVERTIGTVVGFVMVIDFGRIKQKSVQSQSGRLMEPPFVSLCNLRLLGRGRQILNTWRMVIVLVVPLIGIFQKTRGLNR